MTIVLPKRFLFWHTQNNQSKIKKERKKEREREEKRKRRKEKEKEGERRKEIQDRYSKKNTINMHYAFFRLLSFFTFLLLLLSFSYLSLSFFFSLLLLLSLSFFFLLSLPFTLEEVSSLPSQELGTISIDLVTVIRSCSSRKENMDQCSRTFSWRYNILVLELRHSRWISFSSFSRFLLLPFSNVNICIRTYTM